MSIVQNDIYCLMKLNDIDYLVDFVSSKLNKVFNLGKYVFISTWVAKLYLKICSTKTKVFRGLTKLPQTIWSVLYTTDHKRVAL